jgi:hypothetical protein
MSAVPSLESLRADPATGEACVRWITYLGRRVASAPGDAERAARYATLKVDFAALRETLTRYDAFVLKERHLAGTLSGLERTVLWLEPPRPDDTDDTDIESEDASSPGEQEPSSQTAAPGDRPSPAPEALDPEVIERAAIARAMAPFDPLSGLPEGPLDVRLLRVIESPSFEKAALVRLDGAAGSAHLFVWEPGRIEGTTVLEGARLEVTAAFAGWPTGVRFVSSDGALEIGGDPTLERADLRDLVLPAPRSIDVPAWVALVDALNARSRWDYDIEGVDSPDDRPTLAIRGTSGAYEEGCALRLFGVTRARLVCFSHPVFRVDGVTEEGVRLAIRASVFHAYGDGELFVVARAAEMEDGPTWSRTAHETDSAPPDIGPPEVTPLAVAFGADPAVRGLLGAFFARKPGRNRDPEALALDAITSRIQTSPTEAALRASAGPPAKVGDEELARGLIRLFERRDIPSPEVFTARLTSPLAPAPARDAALRGAIALLDDHLWMPFDSETEYHLSFDQRRSLPEPPVPERLREDAAREAAIALGRRALGLPLRGAALDLTQLTAGRVLFDPAAERALPEEERLARAVGLLVLQAQREDRRAGGPSLLELLPDPEARRRAAAAGPLLDQVGPQIARLADELVQRTSLDEEELTLLFAGEDDALHLYRLLSAVLLGHPALAARTG